jgi:hypothetical protein
MNVMAVTEVAKEKGGGTAQVNCRSLVNWKQVVLPPFVCSFA